MQISQNIESLLPNAQPSLDQALLSLILHRKTGSSDVVDTIHRLGYGVSYTETLFIEDKWAEWDQCENSYIPGNIKKGNITTHVADNIDWNNKTLSGKQTHHTNSILIQHKSLDSDKEANVAMNANYEFDRKKHRSYKAVAPDIPEFHYKKSDCHKFYFDCFDNVQQLSVVSQSASKKTLIWVLCRLNSNSEIPDTITTVVPAWSGFQHLTCEKPNLSEIDVGYLSAILDSPTKYKVIHEILRRSLECKEYLDLEFIFLEVDQAIYNKIIQVKFQLRKEDSLLYDSVIERMGSFHILLCVVRSIYSRYKGFGFVELLSEVGLGGAGSIENALKGGDFKMGIRYYKLLFEAIYRAKIEASGILCTETETEGTLDKDILSEACVNLNANVIQNILENEQISMPSSVDGDMSMWLDSFLQMVDMLLNMIHFIRIGNWKGFLETIYEFLPYCFSLNRHNLRETCHFSTLT